MNDFEAGTVWLVGNRSHIAAGMRNPAMIGQR